MMLIARLGRHSKRFRLDLPITCNVYTHLSWQQMGSFLKPLRH